jgi:chromosome segregation ATPase
MASYLGRNVNLALLVIIIGVVVALVGTTVFFQRSLQNRTGAFETTTETLDQCQTALANYQEQYSRAQAQVNQTSQDIRKYDQLYEQKTGELKETQDTLSSTQKQLEFEKVQKDKFLELYEKERSINSYLNVTIESQQNRIRQLENRIDDLEEELDAC